MIFEIAVSLLGLSYLFSLWITFRKYENIKYYLKENHFKEYCILNLDINWKEAIVGDPSTTKDIFKTFFWMINLYNYFNDNELRKKKVSFFIMFFFANIYFIVGIILLFFVLIY
jgi:hypothetical protein